MQFSVFFDRFYLLPTKPNWFWCFDHIIIIFGCYELVQALVLRQVDSLCVYFISFENYVQRFVECELICMICCASSFHSLYNFVHFFRFAQSQSRKQFWLSTILFWIPLHFWTVSLKHVNERYHLCLPKWLNLKSFCLF